MLLQWWSSWKNQYKLSSHLLSISILKRNGCQPIKIKDRLNDYSSLFLVANNYLRVLRSYPTSLFCTSWTTIGNHTKLPPRSLATSQSFIVWTHALFLDSYCSLHHLSSRFATSSFMENMSCTALNGTFVFGLSTTIWWKLSGEWFNSIILYLFIRYNLSKMEPTCMPQAVQPAWLGLAWLGLAGPQHWLVVMLDELDH